MFDSGLSSAIRMLSSGLAAQLGARDLFVSSPVIGSELIQQLEVWLGIRLGLALGLTHTQPTQLNLGQPGSKLSSARLSSGIGSVLDTRLGSELNSSLGSAQIGAQFSSVRFGTRGFAQFYSKLGSSWLKALLGSKLYLAWLDARLGSVQSSDHLVLDSRFGTRLGFVRGSYWQLGNRLDVRLDIWLGLDLGPVQAQDRLSFVRGPV